MVKNGAEGTRTPDFLLAKEALSRLSYSPVLTYSIISYREPDYLINIIRLYRVFSYLVHLFDTAPKTTVYYLDLFSRFILYPNRFHQSATRTFSIPGLDIHVFGIETIRAMVPVASVVQR